MRLFETSKKKENTIKYNARNILIFIILFRLAAKEEPLDALGGMESRHESQPGMVLQLESRKPGVLTGMALGTHGTWRKPVEKAAGRGWSCSTKAWPGW
jgi:hypothetical protein